MYRILYVFTRRLVNKVAATWCAITQFGRVLRNIDCINVLPRCRPRFRYHVPPRFRAPLKTIIEDMTYARYICTVHLLYSEIYTLQWYISLYVNDFNLSIKYITDIYLFVKYKYIYLFNFVFLYTYVI